jgi:hypothetical protein
MTQRSESIDPRTHVRLVRLYLCDICTGGGGGECHVPGCALYANRAPDIPPSLVSDDGHSAGLALIDDREWVRERYIEARDLLAEVRELRAWLPAELWERVDDFHSTTFMDTCTTLGPDCACNSSKADPHA